LNLLTIQPDHDVANYLKMNPHPSKNDLGEFWHTLQPTFLIMGGRLFLDGIAIYVFGIFFWGLAPMGNSPKAHFMGFIVYALRRIQVALTVYVIALLALLAFAIPAIIVKKVVPDLGSLSGILFVVGGITCAGMMFYWGCRYSLVAPLAMNQVKEPLLISRQLTKGKAWRVFVKILSAVLIIIPVTIAIYAGGRFMVSSGLTSTDNMVPEYMFRFLHSAVMICLDGYIACFLCALTRFFYNEKKQSDPSFTVIN
jgi:hypothetical protein